MLLEISIAQSDFGDMTLFHTIQEVIGRINIESGLTSIVSVEMPMIR